ncbi:A24 family peptidase [Paenibacillus sp. CAU 1782]
MATAAVSLLLLIAFASDLRTQKIPNGLNLIFFCAALLFFVCSEGMNGLKASLLGATAGFIPLLLLYWAKGIGAGDVKLFGAAGAWLGVLPVLQLMLYSFLYAGALAALLLFVRKLGLVGGLGQQNAGDGRNKGTPQLRYRQGFVERVAWLKEGRSFPFMLAVAPAAVTLLWMAAFH